MDSQQAALAACGTIVAYALYKRHRSLSINDVPGPKNPSWIYGHLWWWELERGGVVEKSLLKEYGTVVRWNGALGEERLWIADPKAIHHIFQVACYQYEKPPHRRARSEMLVDRGLFWAEGDAHKRQRRAMTPAFGPAEAKALYPCFTRWSNRLADKWHEVISESGQAAIIDVASWFSRGTLDSIGAGAFDYEFGALENTDNELTKSYKNLFFDAFGVLSKGQIFMMDALKAHVREVAVNLIKEKKQELKDGTSRKDVMTLLVKANASLKVDWRLNDKELVAQVRTILFAGHDTTARTLTFLLWELANHRDVQGMLREEIMEKLQQIRSVGRSTFTAGDFDSMPYLNAVVKENLRVHPAVSETLRSPKEDVILPLATPVVGVSGKVYNELPVPAGTIMTLSLLGYNLNKDIWGPDAYEFRPERWLDAEKKPQSPFGVYSNLATFSGGPKSCIGWRFAIGELHTFLVTLIRQFDFSPPEDGREVKWMKINRPVVVGEEEEGPQLPLKVTPLGNE